MTLLLHADDIVASKADEKSLGVVERTHGDIDTHAPYPGKEGDDPLRRDKDIPPASFKQFLRVGAPPKDTVLVRWQMPPSLELLPVSKLKLVDRSLLVGDIVKRSVHAAESGVIVNTFTTCTLQPMCDVTHRNSRTIKGILPHDKFDPSTEFCVYPNGKAELLCDVPASELQEADAITEDSLVIYKDWIGKVEAITNNISIRLCDNCVVEINDESAEQADGFPGSFCVGDIAKTKKGELRNGKWIFGAYNANTPPVGTVVSLRTVGAEVTWIQRRIGSVDEQQPPLVLEAEELDSPHFMVYKRDRKLENPQSSNCPTISNSEIDVRLGLRVRFRDLTGSCLKYATPENPNVIPRLDRQANLGYDLNVFDVVKFETTVSVQWQDLSITTERSIDLLPDSNIDDEHAAWPGEIAHTLGLRPVPNMSFVDQPERVGVVQAVNAAERMAKIRWLDDSHIHYTKNADDHTASPTVIAHSIVPSSGTVEDISLYDIEAPGSLNYRRGDIVLISSTPYNTLQGKPNDATWLGELVDTPSDGTLVVRLGAAAVVQDVTLRREECAVAIRSDGTEHVDTWDEGVEGEPEDDVDWSEAEETEDDWDGSGESEEEALPIRYEDENGDEMDEDEVENEEWESADDDNEDIAMHDALDVQTPPTSHSATPINASESKAHVTPPTSNHSDAEAPPQYSILEGDVPSDHRFANQPETMNPVHAKRTQKEHKILRAPSSLPNGVYIRAWESRLDLLRCLIIGPADTPYANAPFVVDFYLPSTFPSEPPQVSFHSWPSIPSIGTVGRVNPNLYEDGKICLSLLGTWEGNKGEGWSATRSTLLQVMVSLLGLVLVREPYYNEAGYEALVGDEASKRPSALYSERVFLRAKGFLITAFGSPRVSGLAGLADILQWTYISSKGPRLLEAMIANVEEVLSRSDGIAEPDGLTVMSKGACIPLKRALFMLNDVLAAQQKYSHGDWKSATG